MDIASLLLSHEWADTPAHAWLFFFAIVAMLVALDLCVFNREDREPTFVHSIGWTFFYMCIAAAFGVYMLHVNGEEDQLEYYTSYVMEMSLSLDNIFVMGLIFRAFSVPKQYQHRVLFWGIIGVLLLRGIMIGTGAVLIAHFKIILVFFGAFLIYTGIKMLFFDDEGTDELEDNKLLRWMRRHMLITQQFHGRHFFVKHPHPKDPSRKVAWATPLFVALVLVETADLIFAVDSVPAVFAITTDPYVVYTSNIFAILGLRALYFTLQAMVGRFHYLSQALSLVLMFVGGKIVYEHFMHHKLSIEISLGVILSLIACGMALSLLHHDKHKGERR